MLKIVVRLFLFLFLVSGCTKDDDPEPGFNLMNAVQFLVQDSEGNNLIPERYNSESIKLFKLNDEGDPEEIFYGNLDHPRNYKIVEINNQTIFMIFPNIDKGKEVSTTLIEWEEGDMDTLKTAYSFHDDAILLKKVWLNEELILAPPVDEYYFELTKD